MAESELHSQIEEGIRLEQALRWSDAEEHYRRLLGTAKDARPSDFADLRLRHANALLQLGRFEEAGRGFDEALDAAKRAKEPLGLARALIGAGVFAASRGDLARGEGFLRASIESFREVRDDDGIQGEGWALLNLAAIYGRMERPALALATFEEARERLLHIENWVGVATAWELQAKVREGLGDADRAEADLREAVAFYEKQGMREKAEEVRGRLGGRRT